VFWPVAAVVVWSTPFVDSGFGQKKKNPPPSPLSSLAKKRRGSEEKQEPEQKKNGSSCKFLFVLRRVSYDRKNMRMAIVPFWAL